MPLHEDDLGEFMEFLKRNGVPDVQSDDFGDRQHIQIGIRVGRVFFPLWELNDPANAEALSRFDFAAIERRRGPGWRPFRD